MVTSFPRRLEAVRSKWKARRLAAAIDLVPHPGLRRLGSTYGGWWVPLESLDQDSIVYSAGVGEDVSFDLALIEAVGCDVWGLDPTPRAAAYVHHLAEPKFHFMPVGLWASSGTQRFYEPRDPSHVSHSITNAQDTSSYFEAHCLSLKDLMHELGHSHVDLLKLDIEGAEVAVVDELLSSTIRPTTLCIELDAPEPTRATLARVASLASAGYAPCHLEGRNLTLALLRLD
jgi:FkbM family methyltransferase